MIVDQVREGARIMLVIFDQHVYDCTKHMVKLGGCGTVACVPEHPGRPAYIMETGDKPPADQTELANQMAQDRVLCQVEFDEDRRDPEQFSRRVAVSIRKLYLIG